LVPTLCVLAAWAVLAPAFLGIGSIWLAFGEHARPPAALRFWLGIAATIAFLQIWHFFHAVDGHATAVVTAIGILGLLVLRRTPGAWPLSRAGTLVWAVGVLWIANRSTGPCEQFDSLLYHLHATEWIRAYPVVPGLGNLNDRLTFNNSSFLLAALLEPGPLRGHSSHLLNGLLVSAFWSLIVSSADKAVRGVRLTAADAFPFVLLYPLTNETTYFTISSLGSDVPSYLLMFLTVWCLLKSTNEDEGRGWGLAAMVFAVCSVCVKLTSLPFAMLTYALVGYRWLQRQPPVRLRHWAAAALIGAVWLAPWMARGIVQSGYPLFPVPVLRMPVDWAVPVEVARAERRNAETMSKTSDARTEFGYRPVDEDWLKGWLQRQVRSAKAGFVVPLVLFGSMLVVVAVQRSIRRPHAEVLALCLLAIGMWFAAAPHMRYGAGILWTTAALVTAVALSSAPLRWQSVAVVAWPLFAAGTLVLPLYMRGGLVARADEPMRGILIPRPAGTLFHLPARKVELQTFRTTSGLEVQVPVQGVPGGWRIVVLSDDLVMGYPQRNSITWPGPLLRTSFPNPGLRLRDPASLASGFMTERGTATPDSLKTLR
jgi:hypothetical protein